MKRLRTLQTVQPGSTSFFQIATLFQSSFRNSKIDFSIWSSCTYGTNCMRFVKCSQTIQIFCSFLQAFKTCQSRQQTDTYDTDTCCKMDQNIIFYPLLKSMVQERDSTKRTLISFRHSFPHLPRCKSIYSFKWLTF